MKILYFLVLLSALSSILAYNWQPGANNVRWAAGCDFYGGDLYPMASTGENCGGNCANVAQCTHFTYFQGTCYLKHFNNAATATNLNGGVCGWVNRADCGSGGDSCPPGNYCAQLGTIKSCIPIKG